MFWLSWNLSSINLLAHLPRSLGKLCQGRGGLKEAQTLTLLWCISTIAKVGHGYNCDCWLLPDGVPWKEGFLHILLPLASHLIVSMTLGFANVAGLEWASLNRDCGDADMVGWLAASVRWNGNVTVVISRTQGEFGGITYFIVPCKHFPENEISMRCLWLLAVGS